MNLEKEHRKSRDRHRKPPQTVGPSPAFQVIKNQICYLKDDEFKKIRELLADELSKRDLSKECPIAYTKLYNVLKTVYGGGWWRDNFNYEDALLKVSESLTEKEFKKFRGVGGLIAAAIKQELAKRNLSFQPE